MTVTKKTLRLHYTEDKEGKEVRKAYSYEVATDLDNIKVKEVAELIKPLLQEDIDNISLQTTEII